MVKIRHYRGKPNMLVIELRDDIAPDFGTQVAPGVHLHYAKREGEEMIPVLIEIEEWPDRNLSGLLFEERDEQDRILFSHGGER